MTTPASSQMLGGPDRTARARLIEQVSVELDRAYTKHGSARWSRHEFYAVLLEEVDELWAAIKADAPDHEVRAELVQVAAMCFRYAETTPDTPPNPAAEAARLRLAWRNRGHTYQGPPYGICQLCGLLQTDRPHALAATSTPEGS